MWTSERSKRLQVVEPAAELGTVTLGGDPAGVSLGGERRWLTVYSPGGYSWRPTSGEKVMVLKAGAEGESPCILGTVQGSRELRPGEVRLTGGECDVFLSQDGLVLQGKGSAARLREDRLELASGGSTLSLKEDRTDLTGELYINGKSLHDIIVDVVMELL